MRRLLILIVLLACLVGCAGHGARSVVNPSDVRTVTVNGGQLACAVRGSGPPLLLIMGYGGTMDVWDPVLVDRLARHRTVILFDNRGVGRSGGVTGSPLTMEDMARDGLGVLDALGVERADVMGWSMGSMIAQEMALLAPDRIGKLVLYGTASTPAEVRSALGRFDGVTHEQFLKMLFPADWAAAHPEVWDRLPVPAVPATAESMVRQREAMLGWSGSAGRLASLKCSVLVVVGEQDMITPEEDGLAVVSRIPGAWLARFRGAGHWLMYQVPEGLSRTVETFLSTDQDLMAR
ncbi:alpha/beta fold hydrolase [Pseudodesulfovibrio sp.]|uniref:alpha/beta fold hydrolase n=1 Tax=unclassified Pseudodesulfovibrio TaxID=2661612 RepID=UPI003B006C90